jgi:exosortase A
VLLESGWSRRNWLTATSALAIGFFLLAFIFLPEIMAAVQVWLGSTAFNHCFLVLPVSIYLAWQRREAIAATPPHPVPWIALCALPVAACWLVAERIGIMEGQQLLAMTVVQILFLAVLGPGTARVVLAPLLYLFFLIPTGEFLVPGLQSFTAHFITAGLDLLGIVNFTNGAVIEIPEGRFYVAEACAGLRFLIASAAFGALYACLMYRSSLKRLLFLALSLTVPVVANGLRALGIVLTAHFVGSSEGIAADHVLYGWVFFSIVIFLLILIGLPFRERPRIAVASEIAVASGQGVRAGSFGKGAVIAVATLILVTATARLLASDLDRFVEHGPSSVKIGLPDVAGCQRAPFPTVPFIKSGEDAVGTASSQAYRCDADLFVLTLSTYPARIGARPVFGALRPGVAEQGWETVATKSINVGVGSAVQHWSETEFARDGQYAIVASALWVAGRPAAGIEGRIRQALNAFRVSRVPPITAIIIYRTAETPDHARRSMDRFLDGSKGLSNLIGRMDDRGP